MVHKASDSCDVKVTLLGTLPFLKAEGKLCIYQQGMSFD